jgi:hypothetical protein
VEDFLDEEGIKHKFSAPYTPTKWGGQKKEPHSYRDDKNYD